MNGTRATVVALALLALAPSSALATNVSRIEGSGQISIGTGQHASVSIDLDEAGTSYVITASDGFANVTNCTPGGATVTCPRTPPAFPGAGIQITFTGSSGEEVIKAGYGTDNLHAGDAVQAVLGAGNDFYGGSANSDHAFGDEGNDVIDGGAGPDFLGGGTFGHFAGADPGSDRVFGGPGHDNVGDRDVEGFVGPDVLDGGGCSSAASSHCPATPQAEGPEDIDSVQYFTRSAAVTLDLTGTTGGQVGENDTVQRVEGAQTGSGPDVVKGNADTNYFETGDGADTVDVAGDPGSADEVDCGEATDTVTAADPDDELTDCDGGGNNGGGNNNGGGGSSNGSATPVVTTTPVLTTPVLEGARAGATSRVAQDGSFSVGVANCEGTGPSCGVSTTATAPAAAVGAAARRKKKGNVKLGGSRFTVAAGKTAPVKVKLTKKALRALKRRRKAIRATVTIAITRGTSKATRKLVVKLKPPKVKKKRRARR